MWMQAKCDFDDLSFGEDIMNPMIICDTCIPEVKCEKIKTTKNFGQNKSKITPIRKEMKLYSAVFRHDAGRINGNCFTYSTVKAVKINLGSRDLEKQLHKADLRFMVKVNMVATYIGAQDAIFDAKTRFKPSPQWYCDTVRILLDNNGNGIDADQADKFLKVMNSDDANDEYFLDDLREVMLMIAVRPINYIIHKGSRRFRNADMANKIIRTANEVSHDESCKAKTFFIFSSTYAVAWNKSNASKR